MYRSVVSRPNTSPPRSAREPGRARHMRRRAPHPQSRVRPLSTASSPAIRRPPQRHVHDHMPAPRNCSATRSPNARPVTSRLGGNGQSGSRGEEIRFFTPLYLWLRHTTVKREGASTKWGSGELRVMLDGSGGCLSMAKLRRAGARFRARRTAGSARQAAPHCAQHKSPGDAVLTMTNRARLKHLTNRRTSRTPVV